MSDLRTPLHDLILTTLTAHAGLQAVLGNPARVHDQRPAMATFPYVTLGEGEQRDMSAKGLQVESHLLTLHVYSRQRGGRQTRQILALIREALHDANLSGVTRMMEEFAAVTCDETAQASHGIARYRIILS